MSRKFSAAYDAESQSNISVVWTSKDSSKTKGGSTKSKFTLAKIDDLEQTGGRREVQILKLVSVILLPITTLIVLTSVSLGQAVNLRQEAVGAQAQIELNLIIDDIVTNFQIERGTTATYLSSKGLNTKVYERLLVLRTKSDSSLAKLPTWPVGGFRVPGLQEAVPRMLNPTNYFFTRSAFEDYLYRYRAMVKAVSVSVNENVHFYTLIDAAFMDWSITGIKVPESGRMWSKVVSATSMLKASDAIGIQRALGATFFTLCGFSQSTYNWFLDLEGETDVLLSLAFDYHNLSAKTFMELYDGSRLNQDINRGKDIIQSPDYTAVCDEFSNDVRFDNSRYWFDNLTSYMVILYDVRRNLNNEIITNLEEVMQFTNTQVAIYSVVMVAVTICSIAISVWYTARIFSIIDKIRVYALKVVQQSHELQAERRKTDLLLYQMLPPFVTALLKAEKTVDAEHFDSVSVYFSDIVGFTTISSNSSPLQVIDLLNNLYSVFDASIDRYNVYKVETIGDAYMVASGLPEKTDLHAAEIANLSLELLQSAADFFIPHLPDTSLRLRIGIHTGPCVAGVVGIKMPRYCLFGETISIASKMEATSKAQMVHIGQNTYDELTKQGGYTMIPREDPIELTGQKVKTYWLTGTTKKVSTETP